MDNDAILMPQNDALAIEYQLSYRAPRRDRDVADVVNDPFGFGDAAVIVRPSW